MSVFGYNCSYVSITVTGLGTKKDKPWDLFQKHHATEPGEKPAIGSGQAESRCAKYNVVVYENPSSHNKAWSTDHEPVRRNRLFSPRFFCFFLHHGKKKRLCS